MLKAATLLMVVSAFVILPGCNNDCCECDYAPASAPQTGATTAKVESTGAKMPKVSGKWEGRWETEGPGGHGGGLKCVAVEDGPNKWTATFTAEFGKIASYNIKLDGKPGDGAVVFGGKVDLGIGDLGIFNWTGRATETEFTGKYVGTSDKGTFKMTRPKQ